MVSPIQKKVIISTIIVSLLILFVKRERNCGGQIKEVNYHINRLTEVKGTPFTKVVKVDTSQPVVYIITPTYLRQTQRPDMTRLAQTLMNAKSIHWIVIEDSVNKTKFVTELLQRKGINNTHLNVGSQKDRKMKVRGCAQRNLGLSWIKNHIKYGVIYFADDDNSFDDQLFDEIRNTEKVGLIPVGNMAYKALSSPIVKNGKVVGLFDPMKTKRKFAIDMAGISINVAFWLKRGAPLFSNKVVGHMETRLLEALNITLADMEPKGKNGTLLLAWHTQTKGYRVSKNYVNIANHIDSNLPKLIRNLVFSSNNTQV